MSEVGQILRELAKAFSIRELDGLCRRWMTDRPLLGGHVVWPEERD